MFAGVLSRTGKLVLSGRRVLKEEDGSTCLPPFGRGVSVG